MITIELQPVKEEHDEFLFDLMNHEPTTRFLESGFFPMTPQQIQEYRKKQMSSDYQVYKTIIGKDNFFDEQEPFLVGFIKLQIHSWIHRLGELGFIIRPSYQGRGCASAAVERMVRLSFDILNLYKVQMQFVEKQNATRSIAARKQFEKDGTLKKVFYYKGEYLDKEVWGITQEKYRKSKE